MKNLRRPHSETNWEKITFMICDLCVYFVTIFGFTDLIKFELQSASIDLLFWSFGSLFAFGNRRRWM